MLIRTRRSWELPESAATPENVWMNRRAWLKGAGFAGLGLATSGLVPTAAMAAIGGYPYPRNEAYQLDRALTDEELQSQSTSSPGSVAQYAAIAFTRSGAAAA